MRVDFLFSDVHLLESRCGLAAASLEEYNFSNLIESMEAIPKLPRNLGDRLRVAARVVCSSLSCLLASSDLHALRD